MAEASQNKAIGISFLGAGVGLSLALGLAIDWVFAPAGTAMAIVGLGFLIMDEDAEEGGDE